MQINGNYRINIIGKDIFQIKDMLFVSDLNISDSSRL